MNTITTLKRALVPLGAALVIAVPAAQAHQGAWAQGAGGGMGHHSLADLATLNQVVADPAARSLPPLTAATPPNVPGVQSVRFARGAQQLAEPLAVTPIESSTDWANIGIGAAVVALAFASLFVAARRVQPPRATGHQS